MASGNQRRSCYRYRERASVTVAKKQLRPALLTTRTLGPVALAAFDRAGQMRLTTPVKNTGQTRLTGKI